MEEQNLDKDFNQSSEPSIDLKPGPEITYAGFWARFFAYILDSIILGLAMMIVLFASYDMFVAASLSIVYGQEIDIQRTLTSSLLVMLVTIVFWKYKSATPGKMMMGMSIVDATTGGPVSTGMLTLRYFAYTLSILPLCLGFFWIAIDKRKQAFHDKLANTVVVMNLPKADDDEIDRD